MGRAASAGMVVAVCFALVDCSSSDKLSSKVDPKYGVASSPRVIEPGQPVPKGGGTYRVGKPYTVAGRVYVPEQDLSYRAEGMASWYGGDFHGRRTANGEVYDMHGISAAHPTLPMPSYVRVTNIANKRSLIVRVNDRGPYHDDRVIDLSTKAAQLLGFHNHGVARVRVEYVGRASIDGSDDRALMATLRHGEPVPAPASVMVAGSKPFVPDFNNTFRVARGGPVSGSVPVPRERPFSLGEPQLEQPTRSPQNFRVAATDAARVPVAARAELGPRPAETLSRTAPAVSAYAPVSAPARADIPASFISGRGLY